MGEFIGNNIQTILGIGIGVLIIVIIMTGYVKAPPDQAFIISGLKKKARIVIGKASIKIPFLERMDKLNLGLVSVDVKTNSAVPTAEYINIFVDAVANVKIGSEIDSIESAAENFLNRDKQYIASVAQQVLEGNMREIVGQMKLSELVSERDKFAAKVQENAMKDMKRMGLDIVNLTVQNFIDENQVIENLGMDNIVQIQKGAAIAKARGEKEISVAQSQAKEETNKARITAETLIAQQENELAIRKAELKKEADVKQAEADAAYEIQKEEQRKTIEVTIASANIAKQEKEVELKAKEVEVKERTLEAEVKKQAEAEKFAKQQRADADLYERQKEAEAKKYEMIQNAEAVKVQAQAERFANEQEAEAIRAKGLAEAEAIKAKSLAEAEGIEKKAEAMTKMGQAAVLEMYFKALPDVVKSAAEPLNNVDKITMYGDGNSAKLVKDIMQSVSQVTDGLKESAGVDLQALLSGFVGGKMGASKESETGTPVRPVDTEAATTEERGY